MIQEFILSKTDLNIPGLEISSDNWHLGETPDIEVCDITIRLADNPLAINYYQLCQLNNEKLSNELEMLYKRYDLWLIKNTVSIIDRSKFCNVIEFGFQCSFNDEYPVQIRELMPQTDFIKPALSGGFRFNADIGAGGEASVPKTEIDYTVGTAAGYGDLSISTSVNMGINLSFPVLTPIIQTIGQNSRYSEWLIKKDQKPLVGDQTLTQIVLTEKGLPDLKFKSRVYITTRRFNIFNSRQLSNWIDLSCELI